MVAQYLEVQWLHFCMMDKTVTYLCHMSIDNVCACLCFSLIFPGVRLSSDAQFSDFLDGLGPAQLVGRQTLATPPMGQNPQNPFK